MQAPLLQKGTLQLQGACVDLCFTRRLLFLFLLSLIILIILNIIVHIALGFLLWLIMRDLTASDRSR